MSRIYFVKGARVIGAVFLSLLLAFSLVPKAAGADQSEEEFMAEYLMALVQRDLAKLEKMTYWENIPDRSRESVRDEIRELFKGKTLGLEFRLGWKVQLGGATAWNMAPTHSLDVKQVLPIGGEMAEITFSVPLARHDGRFVRVLALDDVESSRQPDVKVPSPR